MSEIRYVYRVSWNSDGTLDIDKHEITKETPSQKPALLPPDSTYWVQTIFGIDSFLSWEDKPRSINIRAVDDPHSYVWHPDGRSWLDRVLSIAYDWRTLHIAPNGYFDGNETANAEEVE